MKRDQLWRNLFLIVLGAGLFQVHVTAKSAVPENASSLHKLLHQTWIDAHMFTYQGGPIDQTQGRLECAMLLREALETTTARPVAAEKPIVSKRANDVIVMLTNDSGRLTGGKNAICILFQDNATGNPADVQDVSMKFTLRVGRNPGQPKAAELGRDGVGRFCGHVDLGRQYYDPANYYVEIRYTDTTRAKRKITLWATVK